MLDLLNQRPRILQSSLEVLTLEIFERLHLRTLNFERLDDEKQKLYAMLNQIIIGISYGRRETSESMMVYQQMFALERERRQQDVECWRDIVMVMRDLLHTWEGFAQAKSKAKMLEDLGDV